MTYIVNIKVKEKLFPLITEINVSLSSFYSCCGIRILHSFGGNDVFDKECRNLIYDALFLKVGGYVAGQGASKIVIADRVRLGFNMMCYITCHEFMLHHNLEIGKATPNYNEKTQDVIAEYVFTREDREEMPNIIESDNYIINLGNATVGDENEYKDISWG